jgi:3-hydroxy-9,10-secoandrosta-1,3,5(10)-triene-9,17-dione monooxygenase reductase component
MSTTLRNAFGHFATGVTIITMLDSAGRRVGMTANSFSSLSLDPPLVLWSLARTSGNHQAFCATTHFAVHVLDSRQTDLARHFATKDIDRFGALATEVGLHGLPLLSEYHARFQCENAGCHDGGDHTIIVGRVLCVDERPGDPLLFYRGKFASVHPVSPGPLVPRR